MIWFCMLLALSWFSLLLLCFIPFIPVGLLMKTWGSNTPNTPRRYRGRVENIREMHQKHLLLPGVFKLMEELPNYSVRVDLHENAPVISHSTLSVFFIFHPPPTFVFLLELFGLKKVDCSDHQTSPAVWSEKVLLVNTTNWNALKKENAKVKRKAEISRLLVANSKEQPINVWRPPTLSKCGEKELTAFSS